MPVIDSAELTHFNFPYGEQLYCGLDTAVTLEVWEELQTNKAAAIERQSTGAKAGLSNVLPSHIIYDFERALQAPAMEMMLRGFLVDENARRSAVEVLSKDLSRLQIQLDRLTTEVWGKPLNARSPVQLQRFFYGAMGIPEIWKSVKGVRRLAMDRDTLEKIYHYFFAKPIVAHILAIRDLAKQREVLETEIDADSRMRTSFNIAGTETGRWSSSSSSEGTGGNLQNVSPRLRHVFVADPGWKLCAIDLEQAESREVGWLCGVLFNEWTYYDACLAGDLHTTTAKLIWPNLGWTGDPKADRAIADQSFYREFSYRDMSKRGGHGTSYLGTPSTMAMHLKVTKRIMEDFQAAFFGAYPGIAKWHGWVATQIQTTHKLTTIFGRQREFYGRVDDLATIREAVAFAPQSATADRMNLILWRLWRYMGTRIKLLAQVHDAVYFLYRETDDEADVIRTALSHFDIPIEHPSGRRLLVPGEAKVGFNWGNWDADKNPDGLKKFKGEPDTRKRSRPLGGPATSWSSLLSTPL